MTSTADGFHIDLRIVSMRQWMKRYWNLFLRLSLISSSFSSGIPTSTDACQSQTQFTGQISCSQIYMTTVLQQYYDLLVSKVCKLTIHQSLKELESQTPYLLAFPYGNFTLRLICLTLHFLETRTAHSASCTKESFFMH